MATTTLTSLAPPKPVLKELCTICEAQPYDLICTCGDKFDFNCIHQHVEQISYEFQEQYQQVSEKLAKINDLQTKENKNTDGARALIENWKSKRIQDINDIAEKALNDVERQENIFTDVASFQEMYNQLSTELHRVVHENLNNLIKLNRDIQDRIEDFQHFPTYIDDDTSLDAAMQSKLNPLASNLYASSLSTSSSLNNQRSTTIENEPTISLPSLPRTELTREISRTEPTFDLTRETTRTEPAVELTREITRPEPRVDLTREEPRREPTVDTTKTNGTTHEPTNNDEFEAGHTRHIQRVNPIIVPTNNDKYAATVCCHNNQLIYNDFDRTTQQSRLTFIRDVTNPTTKQTIDWDAPDSPINATDDEWIQDIVYSNKLSSYLLLNRSRLRVFKDETNELNEYYQFNDRIMKRISSDDKYIYVTSTHGSAPYNGDEIILMNYNKEEQVCKTFRDIIPSRINRGSGPLVGEISDIAVGSNDQVTIAYRLERRHEVGVCVFNVINDGKEWSCIKQLLLNECWHSDLSYTPRIDWCEKLNVFILIEYMTGHLIMIDQEGQVEGECRFMQVENRRESPINLTISTNDWLCVRYESSISIHKLTS